MSDGKFPVELYKRSKLEYRQLADGQFTLERIAFYSFCGKMDDIKSRLWNNCQRCNPLLCRDKMVEQHIEANQ